MNVGIIVDNEYNDDIRVTKEVDILREFGLNVFILCLGYRNKIYNYDSNIERILLNKKVKNYLFAIINRFPFYEYIWGKKISNFIIKNEINILHVHDLYMSKAAYQGVQSSKKECPIILDLHENYPEAIKSYNWTKGWIRNYLIKPDDWMKKEEEYLSFASKIIVLSDDFKLDLCRRYHFLIDENIIVYPNVIDISKFKNYELVNTIPKSKHTTFFYFGAVAERRGIFNVINAVKDISEKGLKLKLLIIGPIDNADKNKFYAEINRQSLKHIIDYIPWINISSLPSYMNISDVCLAPFIKNPQHESGIANKIFQYMYGKKAIIASDCAPQQLLIETANCGIIFSNQNALIKSMIILIEKPDLCRKMGENGYKYLIDQYGSGKYDTLLTSIYENK